MRKMMITLWIVLSLTTFATGRDIAFRNTKLADAKGHQTKADLIFGGQKKTLVVRVADKAFVEIPYSSIDTVSYEYSKHHRVKQGAIVMVASPRGWRGRHANQVEEPLAVR